MQVPRASASFRQGITTDTSGKDVVLAAIRFSEPGCVESICSAVTLVSDDSMTATSHAHRVMMSGIRSDSLPGPFSHGRWHSRIFLFLLGTRVRTRARLPLEFGEPEGAAEARLGTLSNGLEHLWRDNSDPLLDRVAFRPLDHHAAGKGRQTPQPLLGRVTPLERQGRLESEGLLLRKRNHLATELARLVAASRGFRQVVPVGGIGPAATASADLGKLARPAPTAKVRVAEVVEDGGPFPDGREGLTSKVSRWNRHIGARRDISFRHDPAVMLAGRAAPLGVVLEQRRGWVKRVDDSAEMGGALGADDQVARSTRRDRPRIFRGIEDRDRLSGFTALAVPDPLNPGKVGEDLLVLIGRDVDQVLTSAGPDQEE